VCIVGIDPAPSSDHELVNEAAYILSIVTPRDALSMARLFLNAFRNSDRNQEAPLYYIDLNAMSPRSAREMAEIFDSTPIRFIDGGIIGQAPMPPADDNSPWTKPSLPKSGPHKLVDAPVSGRGIAGLPNVKTLIGSNFG